MGLNEPFKKEEEDSCAQLKKVFCSSFKSFVDFLFDVKVLINQMMVNIFIDVANDNQNQFTLKIIVESEFN